MLDDADIQRALVIMAHPDDADFSSAGTVSTWTDAGIKVTYCIVTDGDAGGFDHAVPRHEIGPIRQREQRAAAAEAGVSDVVFLGYSDGRLTVTRDLRRDIAEVIRKVRPQRVVCQSPERNMVRIYASHPDHLAAGEAAMCAVYPDARNPFAYPELADLEAWSVPEVWIAGGERANHYVDVTDTLDRKLAALRAHESQMVEIEDLDGLIKGWNGENARLAGMPSGRYAEGFWVMETG